MAKRFTLTPSEECAVVAGGEGGEFFLIRPYHVPQADVDNAEEVELLCSNGTVLAQATAQRCTQAIGRECLSGSSFVSLFLQRARAAFIALGLCEGFPEASAGDDAVDQLLGVTHLRISCILQSGGGTSTQE
ncbi:hypothetical protein COU80_04905 [Candidatus Peregrinibacteria bacterium CG10_big_fil_rev_8_21_14_0_10_55_24]|nr:MAG: hypothetical protein COU80_04905 [Candidatus Peregrinibacteria bacterium CG10_big_fil_rev_8_21_14_0_10_55_24]